MVWKVEVVERTFWVVVGGLDWRFVDDWKVDIVMWFDLLISYCRMMSLNRRLFCSGEEFH